MNFYIVGALTIGFMIGLYLGVKLAGWTIKKKLAGVARAQKMETEP
jgi:uncharacterized membrane protein